MTQNAVFHRQCTHIKGHCVVIWFCLWLQHRNINLVSAQCIKVPPASDKDVLYMCPILQNLKELINNQGKDMHTHVKLFEDLPAEIRSLINSSSGG